MKADTRPAVKHEFEHAEPAPIHDPEQDMTILARWLHRGMQQGPRFWYLLGGSVAAVIVVGMIAAGLSRGKSTVGEAWSRISLAQTPGQKVEIAELFPTSEAAHAARLQAASDYFFQATRDLPNNRDSAGPLLKKALDLFQQVAREAPKESPLAVASALGAARTLEARNELPDAIAQYKAVASGWPGTPEAKQAADLAVQLADPEVVAFYKELYTYKSPTAPSPPPGLGDLPTGHPSLNGPTIPAPAVSGTSPFSGFDLTPPALGTGSPATPPTTPPPGPDPLDIAPPPTTPSPTPAPDPKAELPSDPFAPLGKPAPPKP